MKIKQVYFILNGLVVSIMIILALVLFVSINNLKEGSEWVTHTYDAINQADGILKDMLDKETGMRGFLATGNDEYLEPFENALTRFDINIENLVNLVSDNPAQIVRLSKIEMLSQQWHIDASSVYISTKMEIIESESKINELYEMIFSDDGEEEMRVIIDLVEMIDNDVNRLNILNNIIKMESGVKIYIINRDEVHLEPYYVARNNLRDSLKLIGNESILTKTNEWITNIAEVKINLVKDSLDYKTEEDLDEVLSLGTGKFIMDQIREEVKSFIKEEEKLLLKRGKESDGQYKTVIRSIFLASFTIVLMGITQIIATNKVTKPLIEFSKQMKEFDSENIDYEITFDEKAVVEVKDLAKGYEKLLTHLKDKLKEREEITWIQETQMRISSISEVCDELSSFLDNLISYLVNRFNGQYGAVYLLDETDQEAKYVLKEAYAIENIEDMDKSYRIGEGLIGQVAKTKEILTLSDIPSDFINIKSSLGKSIPKNILIIPCIFNEKVVGIIEIASLSKFTALMIYFAKKSKINLGIAVNNSMSSYMIQNLLAISVDTNKKLSVQQEKLKSSNEELELQSTTLMDTQSELEAQQTNLRIVNEELETNSKVLSEQKKNLEQQNRDLELSKQEIARKTDDLIQSGKYKSEFLANMSHELRTPLNSILILSELLSESTYFKKEEIKFAKTINSSGKSLLALINDILDLSKVEAGQVDMNIDRLYLNEFKIQTIDLFEQVSIKNNLDFTVNVADDLPEFIVTDKMKLNQIINNLLSNSFKFTEKGNIELNLKKNDNKIVLEVSDTGIGIAESKIDTIFGAFKQEDGSTSRRFGGTGLGLSISAEYAKMLGGVIDVSSVKGEGSKFALTIPLEIDHNILADIETVTVKTEEVVIDDIENNYIPDDRKHIHEDDKVVLVIDDDPTFASIVMDICRKNDFKVILAETGESGLYLSDYYCPTGIILDIGLPGIDGWQVIDKLKENDRTCNIPVNVVSGKDYSEKTDSLGVELYQKPVAHSQITHMLNETFESKDKTKKILTVGLTGLSETSLLELSSFNREKVEIIECIDELEALTQIKDQSIDLIILDIDVLSEREISFIKKIKEESSNSNVSIIIYTDDKINEHQEFGLRSYVRDIIIKDGNSTKRLINEIKIFVHNLKENRIESLNNGLDSVKFEGKVVLVVDDDMRNIFSLSSILERLGIKVEMASNGIEAIEMLDKLEHVDLVLMDIMMPLMDGYDAMKAIREDGKFNELPIIALTAKAMSGDKEICINAGANEYLSKPIDKNKLLSILRVWI